MTKKISDIYVTQATYLETDQAAISGEVAAGTVYNETLTVNYSNLPDLITVSHTNTDFSLSTDEYFGEGCGDFGSQTIGISYLSESIGQVSDTIVITCAEQTLNVPVTLNVTKQTQAIHWEQDLTAVTIQDTVPLTASSSAGLDISYTSSDEAVAVILEGNILAFAGEGEAVITASQEGNDLVNAAQAMTKSVSVTRIVPTINTLPTAGTLTYGQTLSESALTGGEASVAGTFVWENEALTPDAGAEQKFPIAFVPDIPAFYETLFDTVAVNVNKASQTISWEQDLLLLNAGDTIVLQAAATSGLPISYSHEAACISISNDTLIALFVGNGSIAAAQTGNDNYLSAEAVTQSFSILAQGVSVISMPEASDITYGQTLSNSELTGGQFSITGTFQWTDPTLRPDAGTQKYSVSFVPDDTSLSDILLEASVTVNKATQTVEWEQDLSNMYVGDTVMLDASATSGLAVSYEIADSSVVTLEGRALIALKAGQTSVKAYQDGNDNYEAASGMRLYVTVTDLAAEPETGTGTDTETDSDPETGSDSGTETDDSDTGTETNPSTALGATDAPVALRVYPNPASDALHIQTDAALREVRLYDAAGRLILSEPSAGTQATTLQVSSLPRGVYRLCVRTDAGTAVKAVICR